MPLGDLWDRRRLIAGQIVLSAIGLVVVGTASHAAVLLAGLTLVGVLAVVVQVLVAFARNAREHRTGRGRAIGTVTSGVVAGILLARFASGALADLGGWRTVYLVSAGLMLAHGGLADARAAAAAGRRRWPAPRIRRCCARRRRLFAEEPLLRERALLAFLIFADLNVFWTSIVLPLSAPPFRCRTPRSGCSASPDSPERSARAMPGGSPISDGAQRTTGLSLMLMLARVGRDRLPTCLALVRRCGRDHARFRAAGRACDQPEPARRRASRTQQAG